MHPKQLNHGLLMKANPRSIRSFFEKEPKFSVLIALSTIVLLLLMYFCTDLESSFTWQEQYQSHLATQQPVEPSQPECKMKQTIIIWEETYYLPAN